MKFDTIIKGGQLVIPKLGIITGDLAIKDGKIAAIIEKGESADGKEVIDATGKYVMPGVIDPHVHLGLGDPAVEFRTETESAAFGGMTTLIYYVLGSQPYDKPFAELKETGEKDAYIDFAFHFTIAVDEQLASIEKYMKQFGVSSFKLLMHFRGEEGSYLGVKGTDDGFLYAYFEAIGKFPHGVACIHPENIEIIDRLRKKLMEQGRVDLRAWTDSRPSFVEAESINRAAYLAHVTGCTLYLVHITSREAMSAAQNCRNLYGNIFFETCPHYLTHTVNSMESVVGKVNPPLRFQDDVDVLWEAIADGSVDTIGSDHVARTLDKKQGTIWQAAAGFPGVGTLFPIMLSEGVNKRGISLQRVAELTSYNPALIFKLYPHKGTLLPGSDADVIVVDLGLEKEVTAATQHSCCDYTLYEGWKLKGWPTLTMLRGNVVVSNGKTVDRPGLGKYLSR